MKITIFMLLLPQTPLYWNYRPHLNKAYTKKANTSILK